jgi:hypothetical protein
MLLAGRVAAMGLMAYGWISNSEPGEMANTAALTAASAASCIVTSELEVNIDDLGKGKYSYQAANILPFPLQPFKYRQILRQSTRETPLSTRPTG